MLCQFNPVENTYTKLFPLSAFGPNVERLRNGVYVKGTPGAHLLRAIEAHTGGPLWSCGVCVLCVVQMLWERD